MTDRYPITPQGFSAVKAELENLKKVERPKNLDDIARAADHGDLKENAEYHAAKERRMFINAQIARCEDILVRAQVVDPSKISGDKVVFGARVTLVDLDSEEESTYQILSPYEADPKKGTISFESPLARALMGKEEGDEVSLGSGEHARSVEIEEITFG